MYGNFTEKKKEIWTVSSGIKVFINQMHVEYNILNKCLDDFMCRRCLRFLNETVLCFA